MISIENYAVEKGSFALRVDSIYFTAGSINLIMGKNNSGKSYLLDTIAKAHHTGQSGIKLQERVTYVESSNPIPKEWLISETGYILKDMDPSFDQDYFNVLIHGKFDLSKINKVSELSLGQSKLFQLAIVLALHPKILLLDDISNGLDQKHKILLIEILQKLVLEDKTCIIICSNLIEDFALLSDHFFGISNHQLHYLGTSETLQDHYRLWEGDYTSFLGLNSDDVETYIRQKDRLRALVTSNVSDAKHTSLMQILLLIGRGKNGTNI